jgi:cytochrome P450
MSMLAALQRKQRARLPGPRGMDALTSVARFRADPLGHLALASRQYGGLVDLRFPIRLHVGVFAPELARRVLMAPPDVVQEIAPLPVALPDIRGRGVVTAAGEDHARYRETMMRALTTRHLERYQRRFAGIVEQRVRGWRTQAEAGHPVDLSAEAGTVTRRAAEALLFDLPGDGADDAAAASARAVLDELVRTQRSPRRAQLSAILPFDVPGLSFGGTTRRIYATLDAVVERLPSASADCVGRAIDEAAQPRLTVAELRDNLVQLYLAGHDTVSCALAWTVYLLARHPQVQADLAAELRSLPPGAGFEALDRLPLLDAVVKESLRLYPTSPFGIRYLVRPFELAGHELPAGTALIYSPWVTHRLEREFPEPDAFRPERFLQGKAPQGYMPFAFGPTSCVGALFAQMQIKTFVTLIVPGLAVSVAPGVHPRVACQWHGSLRHLYPQEPIRITVAPRVD